MTVHHQQISTSKLLGAAALSHATAARNHLLGATLNLDEAGFESPDLNHAYGLVAGLVADWSWRDRPAFDLWNPCDPSSGQIPGWVEQASIEWRATRRRP